MKLKAIPGVNTPEDLRAHILARGCYDAAENDRIYKKWFTRRRPRDRVFDYVARKFGITETPLADVGCGYGMNLLYCEPGSYGLELEDYQVNFARSIGLPAHQRNIITDDMSEFPKVDTVWCAATLEHVDAPHIFLRRLYYLLKPGGRLVLEVPCAIPSAWMRRIPGAERLFGDHDDHVNSFSQTSLARFCERAGFAEEWSFRYSTPLITRDVPVWLSRLPPFTALAQSVVYVGRQIPGWEYPTNATRRAADNRSGYTFRGMFPEKEGRAD
jgi:SAM-dependent methyltransferase